MKCQIVEESRKVKAKVYSGRRGRNLSVRGVGARRSRRLGKRSGGRNRRARVCGRWRAVMRKHAWGLGCYACCSAGGGSAKGRACRARWCEAEAWRGTQADIGAVRRMVAAGTCRRRMEWRGRQMNGPSYKARAIDRERGGGAG